MYAYAHDDAQAMVSEGSTETLLKEVFNKYKVLESKCQFVLCEGTDFSGLSSAFEFDFNADVAANLGCPILVLVNGRHKTTDDIVGAVDLAQESFENKGCSIAATIVNRVAPRQHEDVASRFADREGQTGPTCRRPLDRSSFITMKISSARTVSTRWCFKSLTANLRPYGPRKSLQLNSPCRGRN